MTSANKPFVVISMMMLSIGAALGAPLGSYNIDIDETSASGVSAGAYMAGQLHVAHSKDMIGVGIIAGGPYFCSQGDDMTAANQCWLTGTPTVDPLEEIEKQSKICVKKDNDSCVRYSIDDPENLKDDKVYIFTGANDQKVGTPIVDKLNEQYQRLGLPEQNILYLRNELPAGHSMVTDDFGYPCSTEQGYYINDCDYDFAGEMLKHLYGDLNPPVAGDLSDKIIAFDQAEFFAVPPNQVGMANTGYAYIPTACAGGETCKVHIVVHGCSQYAENPEVGSLFYTKSGYNEWGEANKIVMLYPQTIDSVNPFGCADFGEANYQDPCFHTKEGAQLKGIMNMVKRLAGEEFEPAAITDVCKKDGDEDCCCFSLFGFCFLPGCCE